MNIPEKALKRFWSKVDNIDNVLVCWNWTGCKNKKGYGEIYFPYIGKHIHAHQISWIIFYGDIPNGLCVCHKCDNPACVNPNHLFLGTIQDNNLDRDKKGRRKQGKVYYGVEHHNHGTGGQSNKLSESDVIEIRALKKAGFTNRKIAEMFGVSSGLINNIWHKRKWAWLK